MCVWNKTPIPVHYDVCLPHINRSPKWPASMLPPRFLGQALCLEAGTPQGPEEVPRASRRCQQSPRGGARPEKRETTQRSRSLCKLPSLGGVPVPSEVCPLGASAPGNLTSQFRFWSLLLTHVESLPSLGQREDVETWGVRMCLQVEVAPGRVCAEDRAQLWAGAPQGDLCAVRCVWWVCIRILQVCFLFLC